MPNINEYTAPNFDLNPSTLAASAWDAAARRQEALYGDAASFQNALARLSTEAAKARLWPFDILKLYQLKAAKIAADAPKGTAFNVRSRSGATGSAEDFAVPRQYPGDAWSPGFNQVSEGAGTIGRALADGGQRLSRMDEARVVRGGESIGQPGYGAARYREMNEALDFANKLSRMFPEGETMTLYKGEYIPADTAAKIDAKERAGAAAYQDKYNKDVSSYWNSYYGYQTVDPVTGASTARSIGYENRGEDSNMNPYAPGTWPSQSTYGGATYNQNPYQPQGGGLYQDFQNWMGRTSAAQSGHWEGPSGPGQEDY